MAVRRRLHDPELSAWTWSWVNVHMAGLADDPPEIGASPEIIAIVGETVAPSVSSSSMKEKQLGTRT